MVTKYSRRKRKKTYITAQVQPDAQETCWSCASEPCAKWLGFARTVSGIVLKVTLPLVFNVNRQSFINLPPEVPNKDNVREEKQ